MTSRIAHLLTPGLLSFFVASWLTAQEPARQAPPARAQVGINLAGPADWSTELPFVDVFRLSRQWISQKEGAGWGQGPKLELDEHGWVKRLESGCRAETPLCTIEGGHYPSGEYTVLYEGRGEIDFWGAAKVVSQEPGRMTIEVDARKGGFFLRLLQTDPADYVRNIRVIMPGFEKTFEKNPWHPLFLNRWRGMACLRFMDFMHTNNSEIAHWSERPTPADATFTRKGVPLELMIDLANRVGADPWFCMPHRADDEYVLSFAAMTRAQLAPKLKVYIEYSNEVWNGQFAQSRYAGEQGQKLGFADKPWEAAWRYTAYRSVQIFDIWRQAFDAARLVRVLPSQAANAYVSEQVVSFQDAYRQADALAIAPYLSFNIAPNGKPGAAEVAGWTVDQVLDHIEQHSLPESTRWIAENKKVADRHGLKLMTYEGGQHMVGIQGGENNEALTKLLHAANAHPRLGQIYDAHFAAWEKEGGDLFCYFSSVGQWSKWGSWGLLQYADENPAKSPKFMAVMRWAKSLGQPVGQAKR